MTANAAASPHTPPPHATSGVESGYAWVRLLVAVTISMIGGVGIWSTVVILPTVQAEFGVARGDASLPYTATMLSIMVGGILMGRLADRFGVVLPVVIAGVALAVGYIASAFTVGLTQLIVAHVVIGLLGSSATLGPLIADMSHWFDRRRGLAVAIIASGNYSAGALWPPVTQYFVESVGWRTTHIGIGVFCVATIVPLALMLRRRAPAHDVARAAAAANVAAAGLGMSPRLMQWLLVIASILCCVAMSMPQVHLVAYCAGLGYGAARGAEMLSVMLACGIASRLASGWIADRIGGLGTLLLGSVLQCVALILYLPFDSLASLYLISALFGLSQGGLLPSYAIVVRDYFPPNEAGMRVGLVIAANLGGMALGGWMSGALFDFAGTYRAAFLNGVLWNIGHIALALWLVMRASRAGGLRPGNAAPAAA